LRNVSKPEHDPYDNDRAPSSDAKLRRQIEANDIKWLMSSKQGRRIVWRLLDKAGVFRTSFTGNSETFFKEGMRNMGLFLVAEIMAHSPEAFALMLNESKATNA
jgi:hypothetical protein